MILSIIVIIACVGAGIMLYFDIKAVKNLNKTYLRLEKEMKDFNKTSTEFNETIKELKEGILFKVANEHPN